MTRIDRSPAVFSGSVAVAAALVSLSPGMYGWTALATGVAGFVVILGGLTRGSHAAVTVGAASLLAGSILAGVGEAPVEVLLIAITATVVAWDAGGTAITLGDQLGRAADTVRIEVVHLGTTVLVGILTAGTGYALYRTVTGGAPVLAVLLLSLAAVLLASALR